MLTCDRCVVQDGEQHPATAGGISTVTVKIEWAIGTTPHYEEIKRVELCGERRNELTNVIDNAICNWINAKHKEL